MQKSDGISHIQLYFNSRTAFSLEWIDAAGYGLISFVEHDGSILCDAEYMAKEDVLGILSKYILHTKENNHPHLFKKYGTVERFSSKITFG